MKVFLYRVSYIDNFHIGVFYAGIFWDTPWIIDQSEAENKKFIDTIYYTYTNMNTSQCTMELFWYTYNLRKSDSNLSF